ncbi:rano class II histocompatibility antigen, D-1 beta chain-like isoform X2 [Electrophorus electricus]|uniref:Major histocompatibility complex class II DHB n=1 Tax=Electrophorus electricus TaxID=8005 RepID=A0AAY5EXQ9_ELEEL|nr:rano class II histocompatibility antigen, D-1 beta chain-like isoform X2 [Electrophorus electricus]
MAKLWTALLTELFLLLGTSGYYYERRSQCLYSSRDLNDMVLIDSYIFNKIEYLQFNSTVGKFVGYNEHGIYYAEKYSNDTALIQGLLAGVDGVCKQSADFCYSHIMDKTVEPRVKVMSVKQASGNHPAMLMCSAYNFYPKAIKVSWSRDGEPVTSDITSTEELADGDWYHQIHSHLEYTPKSGEKISCVVEHASFQKPMVYDWDPSLPESERNKVVIGASGLVLGIVLSAAGFIYYKRKSSRP